MKIQMQIIYGFAIVACLSMDFVQGGCLSYGHSCWGGHGKRSGPPRGMRPILPPQQELSDRWAFLKLIPDNKNPSDYLNPIFGPQRVHEFDKNEKTMINTDNYPLYSASDEFAKEFDKKQQDLERQQAYSPQKFAQPIYQPDDIDVVEDTDRNVVPLQLDSQNMELFKYLNRPLESNKRMP